MIPLHEMNAIANTRTRARRRAEAMGFTFHKIEVFVCDEGYLLGGRFMCVCGTEEAANFILDDHAIRSGHHHRELDFALRVERFGSFSREHLLADGYAPEVVDEILRKGREFDEANA